MFVSCAFSLFKIYVLIYDVLKGFSFLGDYVSKTPRPTGYRDWRTFVPQTPTARLLVVLIVNAWSSTTV